MDGGTRGQGKHSSGVLFCFSLFLLLVAPFHYAIDRCFLSGRQRKSVLCVVERSRTQSDKHKTTSAPNVPVSPPQAAKLAPQKDLLGDILKQPLRPIHGTRHGLGKTNHRASANINKK